MEEVMILGILKIFVIFSEILEFKTDCNHAVDAKFLIIFRL